MKEFLDLLAAAAESHYKEDSIKATNLHQALHMARSTLHSKLKKYTGESTAQYLNHFRVNKAKVLLAEKDRYIKVIAYQVGFRDPNYFSRVFKSHTGLSPRSYRRACQSDKSRLGRKS